MIFNDNMFIKNEHVHGRLATSGRIAGFRRWRAVCCGVGAPNAIAWVWLELAKCNVLSVGARCGEHFKVVRVEV